MRGSFVFIISLILCISVSGYNYNASVESDYETILAGDNMTFSVNVTDSNSTVAGLSCDATINNWLTNFSMDYNHSLKIYKVFIEDVPELSEIKYDCGESEQVFPKNVYPRWVMLWQLDRPAMRTISNNLLLETYEYDFNRDIVSAEDCNYSLASMSENFAGRNTTLPITFETAGNISLDLSCYYAISGKKSWEVNISVAGYRPQLAETTPPFGQVTANDFKLGIYDFDLDGFDDIIVLGDDLRIYAGPDYNILSYQNADFDSSYDFTAADIDSDGDGDLLLGKINLLTQSDITLLKYSDRFSFSSEIVYSGSNIRAFGPVNFNNDFDKDMLIVNGDNNLNLSYLIGPELDYTQNFTMVKDCENFYIIDINKDFMEDLICTRDFSSFGYTRLTVMLIQNYGNANFSEFAYNFPELIKSQLLIANMDSDSQYEIAAADDNVTIYDIDFKGETLIPLNNYFYTYLLWSLGTSDLMNNNEPELHGFYFDGDTTPTDNSFSVVYNQLDSEYIINHSTFFNSMAYLDIDNDNDTDILTGYQNGNQDIGFWNNSIEKYRSGNLSHSFSIETIPAPEGSLNSSVSEQSKFLVSPESSWNYSDYFMHVSFIDHEFRNDYYDSRLNRRFYQVNLNNNYTFNTSNYDEYTVSVWPVTFAGLLAKRANASKVNSNCVYVPSQPWTISTYCIGYSDNNWKYLEMNTSSLVADNTRIDWNRVNATGKRFVFNYTQDQIYNSIFLGYDDSSTLTFRGNTSRVQNNVTYNNLNISVYNATLELNNVSFLNSSIYADNVTIYLFDTILPSNLTCKAGSFLNVYQHINISFSDENGLIGRSGNFDNGINNDSFTSTSSLDRDWLIYVNNTNLTYTFNFQKDYLYLPDSIEISEFADDIIIQLNSTGLPFWNYSVNGSHQTDFRNYTLLENIESVSDIRLSHGNSLNLTLLTVENLSGLNLTAGFISAENGFNLSLPGTYGFNMSVGLLEDPVLLRDGIPTNQMTYNSGIVTGEVTSGVYQAVENLSFSVVVPKVSPGQKFDINVVYGDYFESILDSESCNLTIDGIESNFTDIVLDDGTHHYFVECNSSLLPYANQSGEIKVSSQVMLARFQVDKPEITRYSITLINGKQTAIMTEASVNGSYAYNENGPVEDYQRSKISDIDNNVQNPFVWIGHLLNNLTSFLITR